MSEANEAPKSVSQEPRSISPESLEKLSKGNLRLTPDMMIKGEGEDRRLHIVVSPDDLSYIDYRNGLKLAIELAEDIRRAGDKGGAINQALDNVNKFKKGFLYAVLSSRIFGYVESTRDDILTRYNEIPEDHSPESIERIKQFASEASDFIDRANYMQNLIEEEKFEIILPEQKPS